MKLSSLARRSDLIFARFEGEVKDRPTHLVIRTPANPGYHWGNYLIFAGPPDATAATTWPEIFRREFADLPVRHQLFSWQGGTARPENLQPFLAQGFVLDQAWALSARQVVAPQTLRKDLLIRPLASESDWEQVIANQVRCRHPQFAETAYWEFKRRQFASYRALMKQGRGAWFGAFAGDQLLADLGIFHDQQLGRFQNVETHPDFRRQGICGTLVYQTAQYALEQWQLEQLVIEADAGEPAARIYASLGFETVESNQSLSQWQADDV